MFGGSNATDVGIAKYIGAARDFHDLNRPVVADGVGGLAGQAIVAFGATSGLSYGVATKERFDASSWNKPPREDVRGGGQQYVMLLPGIDRLLRKEDAEAIINTQGGRRLCSCGDQNCCPLGFEDTSKDPKGHFLRQRAYRCEAIASVPDAVRSRHYLDQILKDEERRARQVAKLKLSDAKLVKSLLEGAKRLDRFTEVLENLERASKLASRSAPLTGARKGNKSSVRDGS
jgi:hypothetical protein